jgi:choice-of-anchor C domain-containing protein
MQLKHFPALCIAGGQWERKFVGDLFMKKFILGLAALAALPSGANAAAFINGSFETGPAAGSFITLNNGSTAITGWTVVGATGASVDYIGSYWQNGDGRHSVDLNGSGPVRGAVQQTFDTLAGATYLVKFLMSGNPAGLPVIKELNVSATGNATARYTFDTATTSLAAMGWVSQTYKFIATGSSTTLKFASGDPGSFGAAVDGVSVVAVPEPATWAMMIGGLALAGMQMRRRKSVVSFA